MPDISRKVIPVLIYATEKGFTPPIAGITYHGGCYGFAGVRFRHMDYPRLASVLYDKQIEHTGMMNVSHEMGRIIAFFSKYKVQDGDQNLTNWLLVPDCTPIKIDFDLKHTRFIDGAPSDMDFWLWANANKLPKGRKTTGMLLQQASRLRVVPSLGPDHFSFVSNYNGGGLPPDYDGEAYKQRYLQGFAEEFAIPIAVPYEQLWEAFLEKSRKDGKKPAVLETAQI